MGFCDVCPRCCRPLAVGVVCGCLLVTQVVGKSEDHFHPEVNTRSVASEPALQFVSGTTTTTTTQPPRVCVL
jgi:hypothetical protein